MRKAWLSIVALLIFLVSGTSCVPPSCFDLTYGSPSPNDKALVGLEVFSEPIQGAIGPAMWQRFESGASMTIRASGRMKVSTLSMWGEHCPTVPREDLIELSRTWDPVLRRMVRSDTFIQIMAKPFTGMDDWQPDGPLVSLSLVSESGKSIDLFWDGSTLPPDLDTPVMRTLEIVCSNSRTAKGYLNRNLPRQVSSRLVCHTK